MNHWYQIRRLRMPAFLILLGVLLLLQQWNILSFGKSWPLLLILSGLITIAERAAWAADAEAQQRQQARATQAPTQAPTQAWTPNDRDHDSGTWS